MFLDNCCLALDVIRAMRNCSAAHAQKLYTDLKPSLSRELATIKMGGHRGGKPRVVFYTLQEAKTVLQSLRETKPDSMAEEREQAIMGQLEDFFKEQVTNTVCVLT